MNTFFVGILDPPYYFVIIARETKYMGVSIEKAIYKNWFIQ